MSAKRRYSLHGERYVKSFFGNTSKSFDVANPHKLHPPSIAIPPPEGPEETAFGSFFGQKPKTLCRGALTCLGGARASALKRFTRGNHHACSRRCRRSRRAHPANGDSSDASDSTQSAEIDASNGRRGVAGFAWPSPACAKGPAPAHAPPRAPQLPAGGGSPPQSQPALAM